jgi:hypothetical protein
VRLVEPEGVRAPVFGTAQPPRGLSGALRRRAYAIPEHRARHWALLLLADRVDVVETWVTERPGPAAAAATALAGAVVLATCLSRRA